MEKREDWITTAAGVTWLLGLPKSMGTARANVERQNLAKMHPNMHFMDRNTAHGEIFARIAR